MDHRIALKSNTLLRLRTGKGEEIQCVIENEIGRGGSCIVYEVSRETATGDQSFYRLKEFYPYDLSITREENGELIPASADKEEYHERQRKFQTVFSETNHLFYSDANYPSITNQLDRGVCF